MACQLKLILGNKVPVKSYVYTLNPVTLIASTTIIPGVCPIIVSVTVGTLV
jgi:hypothetical protein